MEVFVSDGASYYPIILTQLDRALTVVVGGGRVGERKVAGLLNARAKVRVISPKLTELLQLWASQGLVQWLDRGYQPGDLTDAWLAIAATDQREVNAQVAMDAHQLGILCNVTDMPCDGNFHVPAVHHGKHELVAVSTYGRSPERAGELRTRIADWLKESEVDQ
jgi:cobalt-precorrin 5A hydrolase/precorrin-3B C17-methyltransferase